MRIIQFKQNNNSSRVGLVDGSKVLVFGGINSTYELANEVIRTGISLEKYIRTEDFIDLVNYDELQRSGDILPPITHPDPSHMLITGTGLTHLGSADARDRMHKVKTEAVTDSMRMFQRGLEGGKPSPGTVGSQPEWFYKGDGSWVVPPYQPLISPAFALDGGEEPEIAGIYLIGPEGTPYRLGFALGNEFSDHVMEKQNYLYLAHSKLRPCSFGPELLVGNLPQDVQGSVRLHREGQVIWEKPFLSGEMNMSHTITNLEHHHFKYTAFRRPGDVHIHFFGTATLSFTDGIKLATGDEVEISAKPFGHALRNAVAFQAEEHFSIEAL